MDNEEKYLVAVLYQNDMGALQVGADIVFATDLESAQKTAEQIYKNSFDGTGSLKQNKTLKLVVSRAGLVSASESWK